MQHCPAPILTTSCICDCCTLLWILRCMYGRGCKQEPPQRTPERLLMICLSFFTVRAKCASAIDKCKYITELWTHTAEYGLSTHSQLQTPRFWTRVCRFAYVFTNLSSHLQIVNAQESSSPVSAFVCRNLRDPQPSSLGRMRPCNTRPPQTATLALGPTHCQPQVFAVTRTQS